MGTPIVCHNRLRTKLILKCLLKLYMDITLEWFARRGTQKELTRLKHLFRDRWLVWSHHDISLHVYTYEKGLELLIWLSPYTFPMSSSSIFLPCLSRARVYVYVFYIPLVVSIIAASYVHSVSSCASTHFILTTPYVYFVVSS